MITKKGSFLVKEASFNSKLSAGALGTLIGAWRASGLTNREREVLADENDTSDHPANLVIRNALKGASKAVLADCLAGLAAPAVIATSGKEWPGMAVRIAAPVMGAWLGSDQYSGQTARELVAKEKRLAGRILSDLRNENLPQGYVEVPA